MIDAPSRSVPVDVVIEVPGHDAWLLGEEASVFGERAPQRTELMFSVDAAAGVLCPDGQQIALGGAGHANWREAPKGCVKGHGQADAIAVEGKHREALVAVV